MSVLIKGIAGGGLRQVDGSHVFQDFAPKNGRAGGFHGRAGRRPIEGPVRL